MKKRILALVVVMVMIITSIPMAFAQGNDITPYYTYADDAQAKISISNGTATYKGILYGSSDVTKFTVSITLQKKGLIFWSDVETWTKTVISSSGSFQRDLAVASGKYRTKAVFKVYSGTEYETITKYSDSVSC